MKKSCLIISLLVMWALLGLGPVCPAPQPLLAQAATFNIEAYLQKVNK